MLSYYLKTQLNPVKPPYTRPVRTVGVQRAQPRQVTTGEGRLLDWALVCV